MKIKTSELTGAALDWAVAKCEGWIDDCNSWMYQINVVDLRDSSYHPSTKWSQGGPIIERERILIEPHSRTEWCATYKCPDAIFDGPHALIAAMRCYVASKLGDEVEIPDDLI